ncbi:hypothetical protein Naga_102165g1 [Nannochloropsis gaditana]|uniref:Uncharacterized protein n=1 Tax=Nannochloropsis gaditana TaxID=72520 RepID=W7T2W5_9STRA|nr:hypothetical protein Naga_102165g1 [Nannochloropsis gaditana]
MVLFEGSWLPSQVQNLVARQSSDTPYLFYCINPNNNYHLLTSFSLLPSLPPSSQILELADQNPLPHAQDPLLPVRSFEGGRRGGLRHALLLPHDLGLGLAPTNHCLR